MRIMIFGAVASGKSTFADRLSRQSGIPVVHADEITESVGREDRHWKRIGELIRRQADRPHWVFEGNAFSKDQTYRIERADVIFVFDAPRTVTFFRVLARYARWRFGIERRRGGSDHRLLLPYFVRYVFFMYPRQRKAALAAAREAGKRVIHIRSRRDAERYLDADVRDSRQSVLYS